MKRNLTDGFIQIAILLSLMRTDITNLLNNYVNSSELPELQEIILGQTAAYTQTHIQSPYWNSGANYPHPKNIDNFYASSIFNELNSLGEFSRFERIQTSVDAWLVSTQPVSLPTPAEPNPANNGNPNPPESHTGEEESNINTPSTVTTDTHQDLQTTLSVEGASGDQDWATVFPGSGLTKEDMDLIEVLWQQDIDLGIRRDAFDLNLRREQEKEREIELQKQQEKEKELEVKKEEPQNDHVSFIVDGETGELIPVPNNQVNQQEQQQQQDTGITTTLSQYDNEVSVIEEAMRLLETEAENVQNNNLNNSMALAPNYTEAVPLAIENIQPDPLTPQVSTMIQTGPNFPQSENMTGYQRQNSFEMRWQDVANMLELPPVNGTINQTLPIEQDLGIDMDMASAIPQGATVPDVMSPTQSPLIQNASLVPQQPMVNVITPTADFTAPSGDFAPMVPANMTENFVFTNETNPDAFSNTILDMDTSDLLFANVTAPNILPQNDTFNVSTNLLSNLLEENIMGDINFDMPDIDSNRTFTNYNQTDDVSSDTGVSSLGSLSPPQSFNTTSETSSISPFDGLEGATGGSEYMNAKYPTKLEKFEDEFTEFQYAQEESNMNYSSSSNDTDFIHSYKPADMRHVAHNHSYPLQPGQQPRESRSKKDDKDKIYLSRDQKMAKQLKLPFTMEDIIESPVETFNDMLQKYTLTDKQLALARDIRRRGKNKVAAQNCRKRKMSVITTLDDEVQKMRDEKDRLVRERQMMERQKNDLTNKMQHMYQEMFQSLRDETGQPYNPSEYSIQYSSDGEVFLVPRNSTTTANDHEEKTSKKRKGGKRK